MRLWYEGTPKYLGESVMGTKFRIRKRQWGLGVVIVTGNFSSDANRYTDELWHFLCTYSVVFMWINQSRQLWCHKMMSQWSLMLLGREVYTESRLEPQGCHLDFCHWMVGSIVKSLTLYFGYISASHGARIYFGWTVYLVYSCTCTQTLFGNL